MWNNEQDWHDYLENNKLFFVALADTSTQTIGVLPYLKETTLEKYEVLRDDYSYTGTWSDYQRFAPRLFSAINHYGLEILDYIDDPIFRCKEFGQLMVLLKDVYRRGQLNYPMARMSGSGIALHPGNHLCWVNMFYGTRVNCFFTVDTDLEEVMLNKLIQTRYAQVTTTEQITEILGGHEWSGWIETWDGKDVPHIYPRLGEVSWTTSQDGDCDWPWDEVEEYNRTGVLFDEQDWFETVRKSDDPVQEIQTRYRIKNTEYSDDEQTLNFFFGFLLNRLESDDNFERI